jgi:glutathione S-transferase
VSLVNTTIDPCMVRIYCLNYIFPKGADGAPDRAATAGVLPAMQKQVDLLDKAVARTGHLAGGGFTLADIDLMPILYHVQRFPEGRAMVQSAKNLSAHFARHSERPSFKATIPPPFPPR